MSYSKRAGALVGLVVASLVAGAVVGVAGATAGDTGATAGDTGATTGEIGTTTGDVTTLQSAEDEDESVANTTIAHDGDRVTLVAASGETIDGETDLEPGTTLSLQVQSQGQSPFIVSGNATVAEDGTFSGTVDLSDVQANTTATVVVRNESTTLARADAEVVHCTEDCSSPEEWPEFDRAIVLGQAGAEVDISIAVPEDHDGPVNVTIGDEESNFVVGTTVEDANADGEILLTLDTDRAGDGSPSEYLSAGEDGIVALEQRSDVIEPPLDPGNYELEIGPSDAPYDVGTLVLENPEREDDDENETPDRGDVPAVDIETTGEVTFITAGDTLELGNVGGQTVRAETELEPGTTVNLQVRSSEPSNPFLLTDSANVTEYGTLNFTLDMANVDAGGYFEAIARHDGQAVGATAGQVIECDGDCPQVASSAKQPASAENGSEDSQEESNVVEVDDEQAGGIPVEGLAAIGVGGLLALLGLAYVTGLLKG